MVDSANIVVVAWMKVRTLIQANVSIFNTVTAITAALMVLIDHRLGILKEITNEVRIVRLICFSDSSTLSDGPGIMRRFKVRIFI